MPDREEVPLNTQVGRNLAQGAAGIRNEAGLTGLDPTDQLTEDRKELTIDEDEIEKEIDSKVEEVLEKKVFLPLTLSIGVSSAVASLIMFSRLNLLFLPFGIISVLYLGAFSNMKQDKGYRLKDVL